VKNSYLSIQLTNEERSALMDKITTFDEPMPANTDDQSNDVYEEEDDVCIQKIPKNINFKFLSINQDEEPLPQRKVQLPVRPRIESKIGFIPSKPTVPPTINTSDNEQNTRNDNSNYDSLVGSLKSDTINWKDQQSTVKNTPNNFFSISPFFLLFKSGDEASDVESEKEIERNLMLQKEQVKK
jgi:hypothetical protein